MTNKIAPLKVLNNLIKKTINSEVQSVADPEFHNGGRGDGRSRGRSLGKGLCPVSRKKIEFYLKMVGFGAF